MATDPLVTLASRVSVNDDVAFHDLEGEMVLLNLRTGVYFGLDPIGTRTWHLLRTGRSLEAVVATLVTEYDVSESRCGADLLGFVGLLREHALVDVTR